MFLHLDWCASAANSIDWISILNWLNFKFQSRLSCVLDWGEASIWPHCHKVQTLRVLMLLTYCKFLHCNTYDHWSSTRMTSGFLVTSLSKPFFPSCSVSFGWQALGRVLVVPNFFHLRIMEATVLLGAFHAAEHLTQSWLSTQLVDPLTSWMNFKSHCKGSVWYFSLFFLINKIYLKYGFCFFIIGNGV